jgi:hypothetical protein
MRLRVDALFSWFDDSVSVTGLTANGLVNVDPRGILYVIGGAGLYEVI